MSSKQTQIMCLRSTQDIKRAKWEPEISLHKDLFRILFINKIPLKSNILKTIKVRTSFISSKIEINKLFIKRMNSNLYSSVCVYVCAQCETKSSLRKDLFWIVFIKQRFLKNLKQNSFEKQHSKKIKAGTSFISSKIKIPNKFLLKGWIQTYHVSIPGKTS